MWRTVQIIKDIVGPRPLGCGHTLYYVFNACNMLVVLNSSSNFVIYYVMRRRFRRILIEKICGLRRHLTRSAHSFRMSTTDSGMLGAQSPAAALTNGHSYPPDRRKDTATSHVDIFDFSCLALNHEHKLHKEIEQARDEGERLYSPT